MPKKKCLIYLGKKKKKNAVWSEVEPRRGRSAWAVALATRKEKQRGGLLTRYGKASCSGLGLHGVTCDDGQ